MAHRPRHATCPALERVEPRSLMSVSAIPYSGPAAIRSPPPSGSIRSRMA
ncbi:MAG: hypothetical protein JWN86_3317 [Planctomycetota bacterium]|nr:hypothetical protein [Planctomycetota bacterium]